MSVIVSTSCGFVVSHQDFIRKVYTQVKCDGAVNAFEYKNEMFMINSPFKTDLEAVKDAREECQEKSIRNRKRKKPSGKGSDIAQRVQSQARSLVAAAQEEGYLSSVVSCDDKCDNNSAARSFSEEMYQAAGKASLPATFHGANGTSENRLEFFSREKFVFPSNCRFFCNAVSEMTNRVDELGKFDLIVIDPPWWNKYIRRKRAHDSSEGYNMMTTEDLLKIPIAQLLNPGALVAVWCTNSEKHILDLKNCLMPAWGIKHKATWCWLKVTNSGEPVCPYSLPPGKQPYEQLLFGLEMNVDSSSRILPSPEDELLLVSVPSAIHSHKPPLLDVLKKYLPAEPQTLEIFARSLLPGCTSWGLEVLKLQHESLFCKTNT